MINGATLSCFDNSDTIHTHQENQWSPYARFSLNRPARANSGEVLWVLLLALVTDDVTQVKGDR